jgi:hypothetical protein
MEKEFIPYEQALALKELGFDEPFSPFDTFYYRNGYLCEANKNAVESFNSFNDEVVLAPLYQQAFKFFREKYGLLGWIEGNEGRKIYMYRIESPIDSDDQLNCFPFRTYEEAEEACINKLIEIVNEKHR